MKKYMVKKALCMALAGAMLLPAAVSADEIGFHAEGYPITDEPVTLRILINNAVENPSDMNELSIMQQWMEETGVNIEWIMAGGDGWSDKMNLMLATGDLPDLIAGQVGIDNIIRYGTEGTFIQMDELIDQYMPNLQERFAQSKWVKAVCVAPDGHIYATPTGNEGPWMRMPDEPVINQRWLDNLGLEMPTTTDELYNVLKAFKEQDADGDGDPNNEIPLAFQGSNVTDIRGMHFILSYFGIPTSTRTFNLDAVDGKVVFLPEYYGDQYKDAIKFINKLWEEGLIDPDAMTCNYTQYAAKLSTEAVGMANIVALQDEVIDPALIEQYTYFAPIKAYEDVEPQVFIREQFGSGNGWVITSACEYPEVAARFIDWVYTPEHSIQLMEGKFDDRLVWTEDDSYENGGYYLVSPAPEGMSSLQWKFQNAPNGVAVLTLMDVYEKIVRLPETDDRVKACDDIYIQYADPEPMAEVYFSEEESLRVSQLKTELDDYVNRTVANCVIPN